MGQWQLTPGIGKKMEPDFQLTTKLEGELQLIVS
jgi:hypothetical protein